MAWKETAMVGVATRVELVKMNRERARIESLNRRERPSSWT
jgi:hypothetical protein